MLRRLTLAFLLAGLVAGTGLVITLPALAQQQEAVSLPELPWEADVPDTVRAGIRRAVEAEVAKISDERNEQGKKYKRVYPSQHVEIRDGEPVSWITVQSAEPDVLRTERWRLTFSQTNARTGDHEITEREKVSEVADAYPIWIEDDSEARTLEPFTFEHDLFSLEMTSGRYVVGYVGDKPNRVIIAGEGRMKIRPVDDYEALFFERRLETREVDTAVKGVVINFHTGDTSILEQLGWTPPEGGVVARPYTGQKPPSGSGALGELMDEETEFLDNVLTEGELSPMAYATLDKPETEGTFAFRLKTADHGQLRYVHQPWDIRENKLYRQERGAASLNSLTSKGWQPVSYYPDAETRELSLWEQEQRRGLRYERPNRYIGMFDIDNDKFAGRVTVDLLVLHDTKDLTFYIGGNPTIRYVRDGRGEELGFVPSISPFSLIYGFEETANAFRVVFPDEVKAGTRVRLTVAYDSPDLITKVDEGFWFVSRGGFLPFHAIIQDPAFTTFYMRTRDDYEHVAFGTLAEEQVVDGHRYTKWTADHTALFPTMVIGKFFEPVEDEIDGIRIIGKVIRSASGSSMLQEVGNPMRGMREEVQKARAAMGTYSRMFDMRYPFDELRVISVPQQPFAQAPTSILYMGEWFLLPDAVVATLGIDPVARHATTAHEAGHQWWGGLVSNANTYHYWFVEGLAELGSAIYEETQDPGALDYAVENWWDWVEAADWTGSVQDDWLHQPQERVVGPPMRYTKGPMVFLMLGEYFGYDKLMDYMRAVLREHAGDLITTTDLERLAERTFGTRLDWFFDQWVRHVGIPQIGYRFSGPTPTTNDEGQRVYRYDYEFSQQVMVKDEADPKRHFRLRIPVQVTRPDGEEVTVRLWLSEKKASGSFELPFEAQRFEVNKYRRMLFTSRPL